MRRHADALAPLAGGTRSPALTRYRRRDGIGAGFVNAANGQGSLRDTAVFSEFSAGLRLDVRTVRQLLRGDAMAHRICYREAQDATRRGFSVTGSVGGVPLESDAAAQKQWASWLARHDIKAKLIEARGEEKAYGGAAWALGVEDGRTPDMPVDWASIRRVSWVKVIRGGRDGWVQPVAWEMDPSKPRFEEPTHYRVTFARAGTTTYHWERLVIFEGATLDAELTAENNGWGESILDRVWRALLQFGASHQYALAALLKLSQGVFQSEFLANAIEAGNADAAAGRLEAVSLGMGVNGEIALGANESYGIVGRPISGTDALLQAFANALVAATDMPEIVLMGRRPGGLSTAADGEFRGWYDYCESQHEPIYTPPVLRLVEIVSRSTDGPTGGVPVMDPGIAWNPLHQPSEAEQADIDLKKAQRRASDIGSQTVTPAEARTDPDVAEHYALAPLTPPSEGEAEALAGEDVEAQDAAAAGEGETLMTMREAANMLGYKGTRAARNLAQSMGALYQLGPLNYRVGRNALAAGMASAHVPLPAEG